MDVSGCVPLFYSYESGVEGFSIILYRIALRASGFVSPGGEKYLLANAMKNAYLCRSECGHVYNFVSQNFFVPAQNIQGRQATEIPKDR
jgi:hypothetical protein